MEGRESDVRTDLFALGLVLYEMTAGDCRFRESHWDDASERLRGGGSAAGGATRGSPESLDVLVGRLLEKDPAQRCASAAEIAAQLAELAERLDGSWCSGSVVLVGLPRRGTWAAAALLPAILGGVWLYQRAERRRWAREDAVPQINKLKDAAKPLAAFQVLQKAEQILQGDAPLAQAAQDLTTFTSVRSTTPGAKWRSRIILLRRAPGIR